MSNSSTDASHKADDSQKPHSTNFPALLTTMVLDSLSSDKSGLQDCVVHPRVASSLLLTRINLYLALGPLHFYSSR